MTATSDTSERDPEASPESLLALLDKDDATNRLLARHPRASAELLEKLSHSSDKATRKAVASHPNTAPPTLVRLGQQFPKEFLANPALDLLLMASPDLIEQASETFLIRLLKQADCPASLLDWAAGHSQVKVQLAVAMNASAPKTALERLRNSKYAKVVEAAKAAGAPAEQLEGDAEEVFREAVKARLASLAPHEAISAWARKDIGPPQFAFLSTASRLALAGVNWEREAELAIIPPEILKSLVGDIDFDDDTLFAFVTKGAATPDLTIQIAVAGNPGTPPDTLEYLAIKSHWHIREAVAKNPSTPMQVLERLGLDADGYVRQAVGENPAATLELISRFDDDRTSYARSAYERRFQSALIQKQEEPIDFQAHAIDIDKDVRMKVAGRRDAPESLLALLAADDHPYVRECVAENPSTPSGVLRSMGKDRYEGVRSAIAKREDAPSEVLAALAVDHFDWIRFAVARNPSTPGETLVQMLAADDLGLALTASANPSIALEIAVPWREKVFAEPGTEWVRKQMKRSSQEVKAAVERQDFLFPCMKDPAKSVLGKGPISAVMGLCAGLDIDPARLAKVVASTDWLVRAATARHKSTPANLLQKLSKDVHPLVAALARKTAAADGITQA